MGRPTKSNVPQNQPLKWNIEVAGRELGLASQTLRKSLAKNGAQPDADGLFTAKQIIAAIYGSMEVEKLATQKEIRRKLELENAVTEGNLLNWAEIAKGLAAIADAMTSRIMSCGELSRTAKEDILKDLSSCPLVLEEVALCANPVIAQ
jgi:hypothetical protein